MIFGANQPQGATRLERTAHAAGSRPSARVCRRKRQIIGIVHSDPGCFPFVSPSFFISIMLFYTAYLENIVALKVLELTKVSNQQRQWRLLRKMRVSKCLEVSSSAADLPEGVLPSMAYHLASALRAAGVSVTMERGSCSDHVHCHAYLHLQKPFHRRGGAALEAFKFEGIAPYVVPNSGVRSCALLVTLQGRVLHL